MKALRTYLTLIVLLIAQVCMGQQVFPVHLSGVLIPPHSLLLSDYGGDRAQDIMFTATLSDPVETSRDVNFRVTVKHRGQDILRTDPAFVSTPMQLFQYSPELLTGFELEPYLDINSMVGISEREASNALPEGYNQICLEVMDVQRGVPISKQLCVGGFFELMEPPILDMPACGTELDMPITQNMMFRWLPRHVGLPNAPSLVEYEFTLVEMLPGIMDPNDGFDHAIQIYQNTVMNPTLLYMEGEPQLEPNKIYAWRVQARDPMGSKVFQNDGYSQICTFSLGRKATPKRILPPDCEAPVTDFGPVSNNNIVDGAIQQGEIVQLGFFDLEVTQIDGLGDGYSGKGNVHIPFLKAHVKVAFENLKINEAKQVFSVGSAKALFDIPLNLQPADLTSERLEEVLSSEFYTQLDELLADPSAQKHRVSQRSENDKTAIGLPLSIDQPATQNTENPQVIILNMEFTERKATLAAASGYRNNINGKVLTFAASSIDFTPFGIQQNGALSLLSGFEIPLDNGDWIRLLKKDGSHPFTKLKFNCQGFDSYELAGEYVFNRNKLLPSDGSERNVAVGFEAGSTDLLNFIAQTGEMESFVVPDAANYIFTADKGMLDFSFFENAENFTFPQYYPVEQNQSWKGLLFETASVALSEAWDFAGEGLPVKLVEGDLLIASDGVFTALEDRNIVSLDKGKIRDWNFSIDEMKLYVAKSKVDSASIKGQIKVPILDNPFNYNGNLSLNGPQKTEIVLKPNNEVNGMSLWSAGIQFGVETEIKIVGRQIDNQPTFIPSAIMDGAFSMDLSADNFKNYLSGDKEVRLDRVRKALGLELDTAVDLNLDKLGIKGFKVDPLAPRNARYQLKEFDENQKITISGKQFPINSINISNELNEGQEELGLQLVINNGENIVGITLWARQTDGNAYTLNRIEIESRIVKCDCSFLYNLPEERWGWQDASLDYYNSMFTQERRSGPSFVETDFPSRSPIVDFAGFQISGSDLTINFLNDLKIKIDNNGSTIKAQTKELGGADVSKLILDKPTPASVPGLKPNGFKATKAFMQAVQAHNSSFDGKLPYDLTPKIKDFLGKYNENENKFPDNVKLLLAGFEVGKSDDAAKAKILLVVDNGEGNYLTFGAGEVKIKPTEIGFEKLYLYLLEDVVNSDKRFPFTFKKAFSEEPDKGSYAYIECTGFKHYNVQSAYDAGFTVKNGSSGCFDSYEADTKLLQVRPKADINADQAKQTSGKSSCLAMLFQQLSVPFVVNGKNLKSFIAKINTTKDFMPFMVRDFEVAMFNITEGYVDYSDSQNSWSTAPGNLQAGNDFVGLHFKKLDMMMIGFMQGSTSGNNRQPLKISIENFAFNHGTGMFGEVDKKDVVTDGDVGGWALKIDQLKFGLKSNVVATKFNPDALYGLVWENNSPNSAVAMKGKLRLPIVKETEENFMAFDMALTYSIGAKAPVAFMVISEKEQGKGFDVDMFDVKMFLCTGSDTPAAQITMQLGTESGDDYFFASEFEPYANMNGYFMIDYKPSTPDPNTGLAPTNHFKPQFYLPKLTFEGFEINKPDIASDCSSESAPIKGIKNIRFGAFAFHTNPASNPCNINLNKQLSDSLKKDDKPSEGDKKDEKKEEDSGLQGLPISIWDVNFNCIKFKDNSVGYKIDFELHIDFIGGAKQAKAGVKKFTQKKPIQESEKTGRKRSNAISKNDPRHPSKSSKGSTELKATGQIAIYTKLDPSTKKLKFEKVGLDAILVDADYKFMKIKGGFVIFNEDKVYGNGFKGYLDATFGKGAAINFKILMQTGTTKYNDAISNIGSDEYRYFFIDLEFIMTKGIPIDPVFQTLYFHGAGGGFRLNMVPNDNFPSDESYAAFMVNQGQKNVGEPNYDSAILSADADPSGIMKPGISLSGIEYRPRPSTLGFSIKGVFSINNGGHIAWGDIEIGMTFTTDNFGIYSVDAVGNLYMLVQGEDGSPGQVGDTENAAGAGTARAQVNFEKGFISVTASFNFSYPPASITQGTFALNADGNAYFLFLFKDAAEGINLPITKAGEWQIKMGTPMDYGLKMGIEAGGLKFADMGAYFQAGYKLDPMPKIAEIIPEWESGDAMKAREGNSSINWAQGNGIAFGAGFKIPDKTYEFLIFRARIYAGAGFDIAMQHYDKEFVKQLGCGNPDGNFGINNWYARGQAYGYFRGSLDMNINLIFYNGWVNLFDVYAAAVLQAELPNPIWMRAMIRGRFSVLNGAIKGNVNFKLEVGERCGNSDNPVASFPVIERVDPVDGATNVNIFKNPAVTFTVPIEKVINITEYDGGSSKVRTFKPYLKEITVSKSAGGSILGGNITYSGDYMAGIYEFQELMEPETRYSYKISIGWKENKGGGWKKFIYKGKEFFEERTGNFTTGKRPDVMVKEALDYHAPGYRQRYWHKNYAVPQLIFKHEGWDYLFPKTSTDLKPLLKQHNKPITGIPDGIPLVYTTQVTEYMDGKKTNQFSMPLGRFPGSEGREVKPVVEFLQFLSFKIPIVKEKVVTGKSVEFVQLNNLDLKKGAFYELEIVRNPAPGYLAATTTQTTGKVQLSGGTISSADATLTRNVTQLAGTEKAESELTKILYRYEFAVSKYNSLAEKLQSVQTAVLIGKKKNGLDHPEEKRIETLGDYWGGKRDTYLGLRSSEGFDEYDQTKLVNNLVVTSPLSVTKSVKSPLLQVLKKGETIDTQWEDENIYVEGNKSVGSAIKIDSDKGVKWIVEGGRVNSASNININRKVQFSFLRKWIPSLLWNCYAEKENKKEKGDLTSASFTIFMEYMLEPYYEFDGWAFKLKFNEDLLSTFKQLTQEEIRSKKINRLKIDNKIEHVDLEKTDYAIALENGRKRIMDNQASIAYLLSAGMVMGNYKGKKDCKPGADLFPTIYYYYRLYQKGFEANHGKITWQFPKLRQWNKFTEKVSTDVRKHAQSVKIIQGEQGGQISNENEEEQPDPNKKYFVKVSSNNTLTLHYPEVLNEVLKIGVYDNNNSLVFFWDKSFDENHEYHFPNGKLAFKNINYEPGFKGDGTALMHIHHGTVRALFDDGYYEGSFVKKTPDLPNFLTKKDLALSSTLTDYPLFRATYNDQNKTFNFEQVRSQRMPDINNLSIYDQQNRRLVRIGPYTGQYKSSFDYFLTTYKNIAPEETFKMTLRQENGATGPFVTRFDGINVAESGASKTWIPGLEFPDMRYGQTYSIFLKTSEGDVELKLDANEFWKRGKSVYLQENFNQQVEACKVTPPPIGSN